MKELWEVMKEVENNNKGLICEFSIYLRTTEDTMPIAVGTYEELSHVLVSSMFQREVIETQDYKSYTAIIIK